MRKVREIADVKNFEKKIFTGKRFDTIQVEYVDGKIVTRNVYFNRSENKYFFIDQKKLVAIHHNGSFWEVGSMEDLPEREEVEIPVVQEPEIPAGEIVHSQLNTIRECIKNDIPVMLVGPAGSGKNFTLQKIADELDMEFYFTNSVQQEYKITGFIDAGGEFHETEFYKAFKYGGLFFLDEIDASIPEVLVLLNAAIANRYFEFPNGRIDAHPDFRVVAAGNTVGSGSDELYTGRMVLDQATLDRFAVVEFGYERPIELKIANGNVALVDFIEKLRDIAKENGIRATFSYRSIEMVTKLEQVLPMNKVLMIAVFKGMTKEDINMFNAITSLGNRYSKAYRELQAA